MQDCANRITGRVQITTDGHKAYLETVEDAFGADIDYAQLQKIYGAPTMPKCTVTVPLHASALTRRSSAVIPIQRM